jgi:HTH-type transcriptional regulator/antitoxin HigA
MVAKANYSLKGKAKDSYLDLILTFPLFSIRNEQHLSAAEAMMHKLLAKSKLDEGEAMYLDAISDLVAAYEDRRHPIERASDADMLQHFLDAKGLTQTQLHQQTGIPKSTISEILAGKKRFTRPIIRKLADYFDVDASILAGSFA